MAAAIRQGTYPVGIKVGDEKIGEKNAYVTRIYRDE